MNLYSIISDLSDNDTNLDTSELEDSGRKSSNKANAPRIISPDTIPRFIQLNALIAELPNSIYFPTKTYYKSTIPVMVQFSDFIGTIYFNITGGSVITDSLVITNGTNFIEENKHSLDLIEQFLIANLIPFRAFYKGFITEYELLFFLLNGVLLDGVEEKLNTIKNSILK